MDISNLTNYLKDMLLETHITVSECLPEDGIRFFLPAPSTTTSGSVFVGTFSEWSTLYQNHLIHDNCTYLVCANCESIHLTYKINPSINLILLNSTVRILLQKLTLLLSQTPSGESVDVNKIYLNFWNDLMDGCFVNHERTLQRIREFPYPLFDYVACIVVRPELDDLDDLEIQQNDNSLRTFFADTNLFYYNHEWIVLYSQTEPTLIKMNFSYDAFSILLEQRRLNAGISYVSNWPGLLHTLYLTATASIDLGKKLKVLPWQRRLYTYQQYNPYYIIHLCAKKYVEEHNQDNLLYLTHPDVAIVYFYDLDNRTDLFDVLFTYLLNGHSLATASKILYMHRNTVLNKINKIQEIIQHKLDKSDDQFMLLLSCMIIRYQSDYIKRKL